MHLTKDEFLNLAQKNLTLIGMSGLGKTTLSEILAEAGWFHYSADYRIGTKYLEEPILDNLRTKIRTIPFVEKLLDSKTIAVQNNITIDNLQPLSTFIGQTGNPEQGGLSLPEFKMRQNLYRDGEIAAMHDVPAFIERANQKGHDHFVNDSTGSLCELGDRAVLETLAKHSVIIYIEATDKDEEELIKRALAYPKPLYFPAEFLNQSITEYMSEKELEYVALIDPDDFSRWVFPKLFRNRIPKYKAIADEFGYSISADDARTIKTAQDFIDLIAKAIDSANNIQGGLQHASS